MKQIQTDILISGAGPGGCVAAIALARQGIPCVLADKATFPRDKICGDALSGKVVVMLKRLDSTIMDRFKAQNYQQGSWGVSFVAPGGHELKVPFRPADRDNSTPPGYLSKRIDFDNFLMQEVKRYPEVQVLEDCELRDYSYSDNGVVAIDKKEDYRIEAKMVIGADGAYSAVAKAFANIEVKPQHHCYGLRAYYQGVEGFDSDNLIELHFMKDFLPGYFWIFPLPNGGANVGCGMRSDVISKKKVKLKKLFEEILESQPHIKERFKNAEMVDGVKQFPLPLGSVKRKIYGNRFVLVGDAAALIDPFTGEGIGNAVVSGTVAAKYAAAAIQADNYHAEQLKAYQAEVYRRMWSELKLSRTLQRLADYPWLFNFVVNRASKSKTLKETITCMFEDIDVRARLRNPLFYLKILFAK